MFHQSKIKNMKNLLSLMLVCGMALNVSAQHAAHSRAASPVGGEKCPSPDCGLPPRASHC